ncbi:pterin 4 alpha carbinolamine dehydratase-domain-containing protein [Dunaliella salina]|uniref:4a-hydroxytetrahydrobiopterin dehydratase n=1 Tax=Dunaliella salina TaxID=3046 RepID=A0ABQ7G9K1_DUNSA|nr:pterin 4 alpha carbinolamine dehydratase-domain-containing protein [Dunaliella salina]|eukprot:KAF5831293.1 pterin 4 alpha carbinolamine dehydratase-domain-containing protein [Dunaliella salina]
MLGFIRKQCVTRICAPKNLPFPLLHSSLPKKPEMACSASLFSGPGSEELRRKGCSVCSKDTPKVPNEGLPKLLAAIPSWSLVDDKKAISRKFVAKNFKAAIDFINKAADVAEAESHHPDLHVTNYREVEVKVSTHAAGGLTDFDFILAAKLDEIPVDYSPKWLEKAQAALQQTNKE